MSETRITRLEVVVFGPTGDNGLVGNGKQLAKRVDEHEAWLAQAKTVLATLRWVLLAMGGAITLFGSGEIAAWLAKAIKLLAGAGS